MGENIEITIPEGYKVVIEPGKVVLEPKEPEVKADDKYWEQFEEIRKMIEESQKTDWDRYPPIGVPIPYPCPCPHDPYKVTWWEYLTTDSTGDPIPAPSWSSC